MENIDVNSLWQKVSEMAVEYAPRVVGAILVFFIGLIVVRMIVRGSAKLMENREMDISLRTFLKSLVDITLKIIVVITAINILGVAMTSLIAMVGAAGLAIGVALSGTMKNFAGGILILSFKPYKVGDFIEAQGEKGVVQSILIFNTVLLTPDNKTVVIPNDFLATGTLTNYSAQKNRRVDFVFGIAYGDDVEKAKSILLGIASSDKRILDVPEAFVGLLEMADSSVNLVARFWVKTDDYWPVFFDVNQTVYREFNENGISIPFPQMDVHLDSGDTTDVK
ncbi:mechanosensitive ion channel protein [Fulvitalea axinellae]|uniref:Mechanosensitive ion channel protein n=1 Tax=Fulvitalea axinellae TaxID=1182444 RepID=A0AAU9DFC0_9BACT|nr:mechanosensitive ion channel protein [Fulvitalea axinellae]